ncbi:MAG TPA: CehA/McbA family metallohydrolase [Puia sp.]|jgi:hypothetical protein
MKCSVLAMFVAVHACVLSTLPLHAQHAAHQMASSDNIVTGVEPQPLLAHTMHLKEALSFLGSSLSRTDADKITALQQSPLTPEISVQIQQILDAYCLAQVNINPESRVKVERGAAPAKLIQNGWVSYLVKVNNEAGITAMLQVESPNAAAPMYAPSYDPIVNEKKKLSAGQVANRFLQMQIYRNRPMRAALSGLKLEYVILQIYCKDAGKRDVEIGFNVGQGSQDIGFRNTIDILFDSQPAVNLTLHVKDDDGSPTIASFIITDGVNHMLDKTRASLVGIYPLPSRRVAAYDEYPDFFFQPQIYRADGEHIELPPGKYTVTTQKGPEYLPQTTELVIPSGEKEYDASFQLRRWINLEKLGWYCADHHIHAAGCSHYDSPEEGVKPYDMWRQMLGENLNVAAVLAWGPSWYHQKMFFTGHDDSLSTARNIMRNDVEVSGFPSSHAGHLVLLRLKEDDYPGTQLIEDWPSWTLPILSWAKSQNGVVGYAHSGWGLEPVSPTTELPNYVMPKMDGIGANEYIVTVTQGLVDFYSLGDTPAPWELNMWYHTLNCGFSTRLSGETDFPCIFDERVGLARSYFSPEKGLSYDGYVEAIKKGNSYVSDGYSHIIRFSANGLQSGANDSKLNVKNGDVIKIHAAVAANLAKQQGESGAAIAASAWNEKPYWSIERARIGTSRRVPVELIVNGFPVDTVDIEADGAWKDISFNYTVSRSCWMALRVLPSSHTNPIFVLVDGKPIHERKSAEWCRLAVDRCWKMKRDNIRPQEQAAAEKAYDDARHVYDKIIQDSADPDGVGSQNSKQ